MRTQTIEEKSVKATEWDENYFKYCDFREFSIEGGVVSSDFVGCSFKDVEWYWGLFTLSNFIDCRFADCVFRGSTFADCRFVDCTFANCRFIKDNLDASCSFERTVAYSCSVEGGEGFNAELRARHVTP